jgi:hypothetical protein
MSRLSIKELGGVLALTAILLVFFLVKCSGGDDSARIVVSLKKDTTVQQAAQVLAGLAAGLVVYERCAAEYQVLPQQVAFVKQSLLPWVEYSLGKAYEKAYSAAYKQPPPVGTLPFYQSAILGLEAEAQGKVARAIDHQGCKNRRVRKIFDTAEYYRHYYSQGQQEKP